MKNKQTKKPGKGLLRMIKKGWSEKGSLMRKYQGIKSPTGWGSYSEEKAIQYRAKRK